METADDTMSAAAAFAWQWVVVVVVVVDDCEEVGIPLLQEPFGNIREVADACLVAWLLLLVEELAAVVAAAVAVHH